MRRTRSLSRRAAATAGSGGNAAARGASHAVAARRWSDSARCDAGRGGAGHGRRVAQHDDALDRRRQRPPRRAEAVDLRRRRRRARRAPCRGCPSAGRRRPCVTSRWAASQRGTSRFHCSQRASARPCSGVAAADSAQPLRVIDSARQRWARAMRSKAGRQCDGVAVADERDGARRVRRARPEGADRDARRALDHAARRVVALGRLQRRGHDRVRRRGFSQAPGARGGAEAARVSGEHALGRARLGAQPVVDVRAGAGGDREHRRGGGARRGERPAGAPAGEQRRRACRVLDEALGQRREREREGDDRELDGRPSAAMTNGAKTISGQCQR